MAENGVQQELQMVNNCDIGGLSNDGPSSYGPPSPLTGCYLLIVLGEPHSHEHKDIILQRLLKGNCLLFIFLFILLPYLATQHDHIASSSRRQFSLDAIPNRLKGSAKPSDARKKNNKESFSRLAEI